MPGLALPTQDAWHYEEVGRYLQSWAITEGSVDEIIKSALALNGLQGTIVTAEMFIANKIKMAIAAIHFSTILPSEQTKYIKVLNKFLGILDDRNLVAHCFFCMNDNFSAVEFYRYQIKAGPLKISKVEWTKAEFSAKRDQLRRIRDGLSDLPPLLNRVRLSALAGLSPLWLYGVAEPTEGNARRAIEGLASPQPPESHSSTPPLAKPQTKPRKRKGLAGAEKE